MTARELFFINQLSEHVNKMTLDFNTCRVERDTLFEENQILRDELFKAYHELSEANSVTPESPALLSFTISEKLTDPFPKPVEVLPEKFG